MSETNATSRIFAPTVLLVAAAIAVTGCSFEPGEPWGYIDARLTADRFEVETDDVEVTDATVAFGQMELRGPGDGTDGVDDFDPSDPPPGFTLCHQGHCHHEDGDIYTYEEIEEGIGVDADASVTVARRDLATDALELDEEQTAEHEFRIVEQTRVDEVALAVDELRFDAVVETDDAPRPLQISLAMPTRFLTTAVLYEVGIDEPERQDLELKLDWPDDLFEDLDELEPALEQTDGDPVEVHGTSNPELRDELVERIADDARLEWVEK